jgi:hypothetical protein
MMPQYHFIASLILASTFLYFTHSSLAFLLCLLAGFLLDIDHILDFWLYKRKITFSKEIFQEFYKKWNRVVVLLHSIELLIPLWIFAYVSKEYLVSLAITAGFVLHLTIDFLSYDLQPLSYFLTYRLLRKFHKEFICKEQL